MSARFSPHRAATERWLSTLQPPNRSDVLDIGSARHRGSPLESRWRRLDRVAGRGVLQGDLRALPFSDESFSVVLCVATLHLVAELDLGLREFHRVLREGVGRLLLPYPLCYEDGNEQPSVRPTRGAWRRIMREIGLEAERIDPLDGAFGVLAQWLYTVGYGSRLLRGVAHAGARCDRPGGAWATGHGGVAVREETAGGDDDAAHPEG